MDHNYIAQFENVKVRPLLVEDIEQLRIWRNDTVKTKFLRKLDYITPEMQLQWYKNYLNNPTEIVFAIEEIGKLHRMVGSVALYDIKNGQAEIGKIQIGDDEAHGKGVGRKALKLVAQIGFTELNLTKIYADVHQNNIASHKNFTNLGFKIVGRHNSHVGGFEDEFEITAQELFKK